MSARPHLLFLHGVGDGDHGGKWRGALEASLGALGYPDLDGVDVIAPHYAHALTGWDEKLPLPPITIKAPARDAARAHRRDFERRTAAVEYRLSMLHDAGSGWVAAEQVVNTAMLLPYFAQARNYLGNPQIRSQVLTLILDKLPTEGEIVIVGHSLGSVIAADLVQRVPVGLRVRGLLTLGSPLASGGFDMNKLRAELAEPPANVDWWVNAWNVLDPVTSHRGLTSVFPWLLDVRIGSGMNPFIAHHAATYFLSEPVAASVGWAIFGSTSKEVARIERGVDVPIDEIERIGLLALRYAHLAAERLKGEQRTRFEGALRAVQATEIASLRRRRDDEQRPLPALIADLAFDLADPTVDAPVPPPASHRPVEEAVVQLVLLATENVLRPFDITVDRAHWQGALKDLGAEMGLGSQLGEAVFQAVDEVRAALNGTRRVNWFKWGALAAGGAALVIATGGLALAAAPGLAGAALVTTALASFGPGGMIGGLITAGTLVTAGGGGIALGLASSQTSAESLASMYERQLVVATLRASRDLDQDPNLWQTLADTEVHVRRAYERMDEFSDEDSPGLTELRLKIAITERALAYVSKLLARSDLAGG